MKIATGTWRSSATDAAAAARASGTAGFAQALERARRPPARHGAHKSDPPEPDPRWILFSTLVGRTARFKLLDSVAAEPHKDQVVTVKKSADGIVAMTIAYKASGHVIEQASFRDGQLDRVNFLVGTGSSELHIAGENFVTRFGLFNDPTDPACRSHLVDLTRASFAARTGPDGRPEPGVTVGLGGQGFARILGSKSGVDVRAEVGGALQLSTDKGVSVLRTGDAAVLENMGTGRILARPGRPR